MQYKITREDNIKSQVITDLFKSVQSRGEKIHETLSEHNVETLLNMLKEQPIYRVSIHDRTGQVNTDCYDLLENFAPELKMRYDTINEMPNWAQAKLAVLMVLDPMKVNNDIEGVGKRISRNVYWLYKEKAIGDDARKES
jgi:hypothetical protein